MSETVLIALIGAIGSGGVATIVTTILNRHWSRNDSENDKLKAITNALRILMIDKVRDDVADAVHDGDITPSRRDEIRDEYKAYKSLGGNGHLDNDMKVLDDIPTRYE